MNILHDKKSLNMIKGGKVLSLLLAASTLLMFWSYKNSKYFLFSVTLDFD